MAYTLTESQYQLVLAMKDNSKYEYDTYDVNARRKKHDIQVLSEAFMKYIDILGIRAYKAKNLATTNNRGKTKTRIFTPGELGKITKYLKEKKLIDTDQWGRHVVKWRGS